MEIRVCFNCFLSVFFSFKKSNNAQGVQSRVSSGSVSSDSNNNAAAAAASASGVQNGAHAQPPPPLHGTCSFFCGFINCNLHHKC